MSALFEYNKACVSMTDISEIDSGDRRSVIIEFNNAIKVGSIIELMDISQINKDERMAHSHLCFITALEQSSKIARGFCIVHFTLLQQSMPSAMYNKLILLNEKTRLQQERINQLTDYNMRGVEKNLALARKALGEIQKGRAA